MASLRLQQRMMKKAREARDGGDNGGNSSASVPADRVAAAAVDAAESTPQPAVKLRYKCTVPGGCGAVYDAVTVREKMVQCLRKAVGEAAGEIRSVTTPLMAPSGPHAMPTIAIRIALSPPYTNITNTCPRPRAG